ncbi:hypothetical protein CHUAL_003897 [Chamberlinius hualienensis]
MSKRRANKTSAASKKARNSNNSENGETSHISSSETPEETFASFIQPTKVEDFFATYWERKPMLLHRSQDTSQTPLFSRQIIESLLSNKKHTLTYGVDVNVVKFDKKTGKRHNLNPKVAKVDLVKFTKLLDVDKATMQIHQPQRFQDGLWCLQEKLESYFGCLVGSNVYITPPNAQGLPPHHDDVEVFILQLEGEKRWRLYQPKTELALDYSGDFKTEEIGEPMMDFVLKPGDLLYFPRGTIHQAETSTTLSSHITISTYQHYSQGDYLQSVLPKILEESINNNVEFRRGLPINFVNNCHQLKPAQPSIIESLLHKLKCNLDQAPVNMVADFMSSRLPPFGVNGAKLRDDAPKSKQPIKHSCVKLKYPHHICVVIQDISNEDSESEDSNSSVSSTEKMIFVYYSVMNDRSQHMMKGPSNLSTANDSDDSESEIENSAVNALKFPLKFKEAIDYLKSNCQKFVPISKIPCQEDIHSLLLALWSTHLLETKL